MKTYFREKKDLRRYYLCVSRFLWVLTVYMALYIPYIALTVRRDPVAASAIGLSRFQLIPMAENIAFAVVMLLIFHFVYEILTREE